MNLLPEGSALTGLTAAGLHGWWLPPVPGVTVFAVIPRDGDPRIRRDTVNVWRPRISWSATVRHGLPVTSPADTLIACARDLGVLDLTCLLVAALRQGLDPTEIRAVALPRRPGSSRLLAALGLAEPRCESIFEVLMYVLHSVCGIKVEAQYEVRDHDGAFVARGDLWIVGTQDLHEYDGATHLTRDGHRADLRRDRTLQQAGWNRRGYVADDVLRRGHMIIRHAERALDLPPGSAPIGPWQALLRESLFSSAGRAHLAGRWCCQIRPPRPSIRPA